MATRPKLPLGEAPLEGRPFESAQRHQAHRHDPERRGVEAGGVGEVVRVEHGLVTVLLQHAGQETRLRGGLPDGGRLDAGQGQDRQGTLGSLLEATDGAGGVGTGPRLRW